MIAFSVHVIHFTVDKNMFLLVSFESHPGKFDMCSMIYLYQGRLYILSPIKLR